MEKLPGTGLRDGAGESRRTSQTPSAAWMQNRNAQTRHLRNLSQSSEANARGVLMEMMRKGDQRDERERSFRPDAGGGEAG